eukprot:3680461-Amphidinium_carterae.1
MVHVDTAVTRNTEGAELATTMATFTRIEICMKQSVCCAEFVAVVRALEECHPHEVVSDCKGVVKAVQALQTGRRMPKGRNRDKSLRAASVERASPKPDNQVNEGAPEAS